MPSNVTNAPGNTPNTVNISGSGNPQQPQVLNPLVQALQILFGRSDRQIGILKGQTPSQEKYASFDSIENRLSKIFTGYSDIQYDRMSKYRDYDRMDSASTEVQTGLDIYGEEASQKDDKTGLRVWIESEDKNIEQDLNGMLQRIKMEFKAYGIYRNLAKYGDCFLYIMPGGYGVHDFQFIHPSRVERIQEDGLLGFKSVELATHLPTDNKAGIFKPWDFCTDSKTEILTETRGWSLFKDLLPEDKVATRNPETKKLEWQSPTNYINSSYEGEMIKFKSKSVDLLVTPNHRMLVTRNYKRDKEEIISAKEILEENRYKNYFKIPMTSNWIGTEIQPKLFDKQIGKTISKPAFPVSMSGDDYAAFMGMYLSEGHCGYRGQISIGQLTSSKGYESYKNLLERILGQEVYHSGEAFLFSRSVLAEHLLNFGLSENKYIPNDIMGASAKQLQLFWDYYMLGDGSSHKRVTKTSRTVGNRNGVYTSIHTTSKILSGQLQEIAQKLGLSASVWTRPAYIKTRKKDGKIFECKESYVVSIRHSSEMSFNVSKEHYNGTVHCVSVPNGIIYIRRNGKPAWTGNCHARITAFDSESVYGRSMLESVRKTWKQLSMLETMVVLYRIAKAVQRNIFYVDVGQASVQETQNLVKDYEKFLKNKQTFIDPKNNDFRLDFNPATILQDIVWPVRPGSASKVEQLQNTTAIGPVEDIEYFKNKIRIGLNIPKDYFDGEITGAWNSKEALMLQDVRFGRKITKLQDAMREAIVKICQIHWAIKFKQYLEPSQFVVQLGTISTVADRQREDILLRKSQIMEILANIASTLGWNRWVWGDYLLDEIFPLPAKLRAKLRTPDPVQEHEAQQAAKLGGKPGGAKGGKTPKPPKKVTADNLRMGLRGFGYGEEEDIDVNSLLTEEFQNIEEDSLEEIPEESLAILHNFIPKIGLREGDIISSNICGFSKEEINNFISERGEKAPILDSVIEKKTNWKKLYEMGIPPGAFPANKGYDDELDLTEDFHPDF